MTESTTTTLPKWPFLLGDLCLLTLAGWIVYQSTWPLGLWQIGFCLGAVALGAWFCVIPFLQEFRVGTKLAEAHALSTALSQIKNLETIQSQIGGATNQWITVQEHSARTVQAVKELTDRFKTQADEICAFFEKAGDKEKAHLRLEVEKLRRTERDWLQMTVHILDHVYGLNQAAARSGKPGLISQLSQFQQACRDAARRLGLTAFSPNQGDAFDAAVHQTSNGTEETGSEGRIEETVASGFTFQGQLIRRALVTLQGKQSDAAVTAENGAETSIHPPTEQQPSVASADPDAVSSSAPQKELSLE
jgi:molecular chaperone GrpE (heat shock protein)